jgi:ketosteroid isomerase-like protein
MAHPNDELIQRFYEAFDRKDGDAMAACYAPDARFNDPVFGDLTGEQAGAMWRMLTGRAKDLSVELAEHSADDSGGSAHWLAHYTFAQTKRKVVNDIRATFRFRDGLIVEHVDRFSFWAWSRQALGPIGAALGWNPVLRSSVSRKARAGLDEFMAGG